MLRGRITLPSSPQVIYTIQLFLYLRRDYVAFGLQPRLRAGTGLTSQSQAVFFVQIIFIESINKLTITKG